MKKEDCHHWSGWPGAYCFKCGSEDPMEIAVADGWFDPWEQKWDSKEHQEEIEAFLICPVKGTLEWDQKEKEWKLIPSEEN